MTTPTTPPLPEEVRRAVREAIDDCSNSIGVITSPPDELAAHICSALDALTPTQPAPVDAEWAKRMFAEVLLESHAMTVDSCMEIFARHAPDQSAQLAAMEADRERLQTLAQIVWDARWGTGDNEQHTEELNNMVGIAAEISSGNMNGIDAKEGSQTAQTAKEPWFSDRGYPVQRMKMKRDAREEERK